MSTWQCPVCGNQWPQARVTCPLDEQPRDPPPDRLRRPARLPARPPNSRGHFRTLYHPPGSTVLIGRILTERPAVVRRFPLPLGNLLLVVTLVGLVTWLLARGGAALRANLLALALGLVACFVLLSLARRLVGRDRIQAGLGRLLRPVLRIVSPAWPWMRASLDWRRLRLANCYIIERLADGALTGVEVVQPSRLPLLDKSLDGAVIYFIGRERSEADVTTFDVQAAAPIDEQGRLLANPVWSLRPVNTWWGVLGLGALTWLALAR